MIFKTSPSASVCQDQMSEDASVSQSCARAFNHLVSIIRDVRICDNLYHAVLQRLIKPPWISFHGVVRLLLQKQSSPLFEI